MTSVCSEKRERRVRHAATLRVEVRPSLGSRTVAMWTHPHRDRGNDLPRYFFAFAFAFFGGFLAAFFAGLALAAFFAGFFAAAFLAAFFAGFMLAAFAFFGAAAFAGAA